MGVVIIQLESYALSRHYDQAHRIPHITNNTIWSNYDMTCVCAVSGRNGVIWIKYSVTVIMTYLFLIRPSVLTALIMIQTTDSVTEQITLLPTGWTWWPLLNKVFVFENFNINIKYFMYGEKSKFKMWPGSIFGT